CTVAETGPLASAGATARMRLSETTMTLVAGTVPNSTLVSPAPPPKFEPLIVTTVPCVPELLGRVALPARGGSSTASKLLPRSAFSCDSSSSFQRVDGCPCTYQPDPLSATIRP